MLKGSRRIVFCSGFPCLSRVLCRPAIRLRSASPPRSHRLHTRSPRNPPRASARCIGARSDRYAPVVPVRWPACHRSQVCFTLASTTAGCGAARTTARTGCRCSTTNRPARLARSPWRRRIRTSSMWVAAPASSVPTSPSATECTSRLTMGKRGRTSACVNRR